MLVKRISLLLVFGYLFSSAAAVPSPAGGPCCDNAECSSDNCDGGPGGVLNATGAGCDANSTLPASTTGTCSCIAESAPCKSGTDDYCCDGLACLPSPTTGSFFCVTAPTTMTDEIGTSTTGRGEEIDDNGI